MTLLDRRVGELLDDVAAAGRTPGGGAVAALVTAAAAGLLAKVARMSGDGWQDAAAISAQAEALRRRAAPLVQVGVEEYEAALQARDARAGESAERRDFELGQAFARAAEAPLRIVEAASDVAQLAVVVARNGDPALRADAAAAAALAAAAARASAELVAVNLTTTADDERTRRARTLAGEAARAADDAFAGGA
jgi:formiminotetrahydrofolate cyclodeaminase